MKEFTAFCQSFKGIMDRHPQLDIEGAREIIQQINEFLYTTHPHIGTIEKFGNTFNYFSDFHKFWHKHHQEILNCEIDECKCEQVADALHAVLSKHTVPHLPQFMTHVTSQMKIYVVYAF